MASTDSRDMYRDHMITCLVSTGVPLEQARQQAEETYPQREER